MYLALLVVQACTVSVADLVDIEENIWAPRYGLKGQLDATLRVHVTSKDPSLPRGGLAGLERPSTSRMTTVQTAGAASSSERGTGPSSTRCSGEGGATAGRVASLSSLPSPGASWSGGVVSRSADGEVTRSFLVPFEFKSGKSFVGHRGQV